jgi:hypothetical protein
MTRPERALLFLAGIVLASPAAPAENRSAAPTLPELFARLAARGDTRVRFTELKRLSVLTQPLRLEGRLEFRPPGYLAKHVEKPSEERYIIEDGQVTVDKPAENQHLRLSLADYPPLEAFAASLRAPLAGDLDALRRYWRPSLGGSWNRWLLALTPARPDLATVVRGVRLEGREDRLTRMTLEETGGDSSTLDFRPDR